MTAAQHKNVRMRPESCCAVSHHCHSSLIGSAALERKTVPRKPAPTYPSRMRVSGASREPFFSQGNRQSARHLSPHRSHALSAGPRKTAHQCTFRRCTPFQPQQRRFDRGQWRASAMRRNNHPAPDGASNLDSVCCSHFGMANPVYLTASHWKRGSSWRSEEHGCGSARRADISSASIVCPPAALKNVS